MESFDLLIIGGGINGTAIARDAAIRELKVLLVEKDDLAQHTSSASSKLIHGGLRYLEYYEFRLVREALKEREILLQTAPHIVRPLSFVLPHARGMRPWWMVRAGLLLYRLLAWGSSLPRPGRSDYRAPLKPEAGRRIALYADAVVDDARLVVLNAVDAAERAAEIATRTELVSAEREGDVWRATLSGGRTVLAKIIVNAAGPWVAEVLGGRLSESSESRARLIKGSHILVPAIWEGEQAYILQQPDGRVVFAIPYEGRFTLIGTTEVPVSSPEDATITETETDYLCAAANRYFNKPIAPADVVWSYSGIRSLYDDGEIDPKAVTRDYRLELDDDPGAKLLSVFGGKITTARALASEALDRLGIKGRKSTGWAALPGGDIYPAYNDYLRELSTWMPQPLLGRLARSYGTRLKDVMGDATSLKDLGRHFGAGLYEAEVRYLTTYEFARTDEDILWRRTKIGLHMSAAEREAVARFLA
ncbi:glycerol-3-phosphate dehydrogenase [Allosphingosinicella sp.]|uniref:glycerol-3-phosphate dehydrogenase n=1 Tax=Allosphingosinicella sp. TaxID=2823234 RepID=UPI002FC0B913